MKVSKVTNSTILGVKVRATLKGNVITCSHNCESGEKFKFSVEIRNSNNSDKIRFDYEMFLASLDFAEIMLWGGVSSSSAKYFEGVKRSQCQIVKSC